MAIKFLIALCLVFVVKFVSASPVPDATPEAEAEADAYYGHFGRYGHRFGGYRSYGYGSYHKRPYFYKPRLVTSAPFIKKYTYRLLPKVDEAPEELFEPEPVVRQAEPILVPEPEPLVELFAVPRSEELLGQVDPILVPEPQQLVRLEELILAPEPEPKEPLVVQVEEPIVVPEPEDLALQVVPEPEHLVPQEEPMVVLEPVVRQELEVVPESEPLVPESDLILISEPDLEVKPNPVPMFQDEEFTITFKPVAAVPEDHISAPVDHMVAPILPPTPIEITEEIPSVFDNDIDVIGPATEEELVMTTDPTLENEDNVAALNSIFKVLKSFPAVPEDHFVDNGV